jgi:hypothetical protein
MGILRPKNGVVFKLKPQLAAFYLGPTPVSQRIDHDHYRKIWALIEGC